MSGSFLGKALFFVSVGILATIVVFFVINKKDYDQTKEELEIITSLNVNTYDYDFYIYEIDDNKMYTSKYHYNKIYLDNNEVEYEEISYNKESKFFLKNLSNTEKDINNIKITYDPITKDEFDFLLKNYNLLKVYIWLDENNECEKALLYSKNNTSLDLREY